MLIKELLGLLCPYIKWEMMLAVAFFLFIPMGKIRLIRVRKYCDAFCYYYSKSLDYDKTFSGIIRRLDAKGWLVKIIKKATTKMMKKHTTRERQKYRLKYLEGKLKAYPVELIHRVSLHTMGSQVPREFLSIYKEIVELWMTDCRTEASLARRRAVTLWIIKDLLVVLNWGIYNLVGKAECIILLESVNILGLVLLTFLVFDCPLKDFSDSSDEGIAFLEWGLNLIILAHSADMLAACKKSCFMSPGSVQALVKEVSEVQNNDRLRLSLKSKVNDSELTEAQRNFIYTIVENPVNTGDAAMACLNFAIKNYISELRNDRVEYLQKKSKATAGGILMGYELAGSLGIMINAVYVVCLLISTSSAG